MLRPIPIPANRRNKVTIWREERSAYGPSDEAKNDAIDGFVTGVPSRHDGLDDKRQPALKSGHISKVIFCAIWSYESGLPDSLFALGVTAIAA